MKRLYRSKEDRQIAGIFGGIGELYNIDPNVMRLLAVLGLLVTGIFPILVTYIIAWIILPDGKPVEVKTEPVESKKTSSSKSKPSASKKKV